jgi:hypothetical protein
MVISTVEVKRVTVFINLLDLNVIICSEAFLFMNESGCCCLCFLFWLELWSLRKAGQKRGTFCSICETMLVKASYIDHCDTGLHKFRVASRNSLGLLFYYVTISAWHTKDHRESLFFFFPLFFCIFVSFSAFSVIDFHTFISSSCRQSFPSFRSYSPSHWNGSLANRSFSSFSLPYFYQFHFFLRIILPSLLFVHPVVISVSTS